MGTSLPPVLLILLCTIQSIICFGQIETNALVDRLSSYLNDKQIPGAMVSIVTSDSIIFVGGIGCAEVETEELVTGEHVFRQGSISKSITAMGILKTLSESTYTLDSPIRSIDPNLVFINDWEKTDPLKLVHLLEHTSGFDDFHLHALYNNMDSIAPPVIKMVRAHQNSLKSRWKPGLKKAYANPNYILAGHLMEKISGIRYVDFLSDTILRPMGMLSSGFYFKEPTEVKMAQGYRRNSKGFEPVAFASINGGPAGEFCSNAKDMATFLQFMLNRKSKNQFAFARATFDRIENAQSTIAAKKGLPFGYGLGNYAIWKNDFLFHGHGGGIDGFSSRYVYSRAANLGVAVAINREGNATAIVDEILNMILGDQEQAPADRNTFSIPLDIQARYAGFYEFESPRNELFAFTDKMLAGLILDFDDEKLITKSILGKVKDTLFYAGGHQFYKGLEGVPSTLLFETEEGQPAFWVNDNYTVRASRALRLFLFFGLLIALLTYALFVIYSALVIILSLIPKQKKPNKHLLLFFSSGLCFTFMMLGFGLAMESRQNAGNINVLSLMMYLGSIGLVVLSLALTISCISLYKQNSLRLSYLLASSSAVVISMYLWEIGFVGLKLWAY